MIKWTLLCIMNVSYETEILMIRTQPVQTPEKWYNKIIEVLALVQD